MKQKIAFVCQRYGMDVNGGAEQFCRLTAEHLSTLYDVTVYTTCAKDYITWANEYPEGEQNINGVRIIRYPTSRNKNPKSFRILTRLTRYNPFHHSALENRWIDKQGPFSPRLIQAIHREYTQYKAVFFVTYLYYPTVRGLLPEMDNAILIPTLHDEPMVYLHCYDRLFDNAKAFVWLTPEEKAFAQRRFLQIIEKPETTTGIGIDPVRAPLPVLPETLQNQTYLVYAGRIDNHKGCDRMFRYFRRYIKQHAEKLQSAEANIKNNNNKNKKEKTPNNLKLVLIGKKASPVPDDPDIIHLGFVDEETKNAVISNALALVLFSRFESLSMVVLESMAAGRPVLVDEECEVLRGHCVRSGAGLTFTDYDSFVRQVEFLQDNPDEYSKMCGNGRQYIHDNYRWETILEKYRDLIDTVSSSAMIPEQSLCHSECIEE